MKCLLCALYWTRCKPPSVSFGFCWISSDFCIIFLLILSLGITGNDSWLHYSNIFFCFAVILQVFAAPLKSELLTYFKSLAKTCKSTVKNKHYVGIIKSAVFPNSFPFLLAQNKKKLKSHKIEPKPNETERDLHLVQ